MRNLPPKARLYVGAVLFGGIVTLALACVFRDPLPIEHAWELLLTALLATFVGSKKISMVRRKRQEDIASISLSFVITYAALLRFGPAAAMVVGSISCLSGSLFPKRQPAHQLLFNVALGLIQVWVAGKLFMAMNGHSLRLDPLSSFPAVILSTLAYFVINTGGVSIVIGLCSGQDILKLWLSMRFAASSYLAGACVGTLANIVVGTHTAALLLFIAPVLYLAYQSYSTYAARAEDKLQYLEEIRKREEQYRLLLEGIPDYAIVMLDPAGSVLSWNGGAERISGYSSVEIIGQPYPLFLPPEPAGDSAVSELTVALAEGRYEDDGWRERKDGSRFWAHVIITPMYDDQDELRGFSKVMRDMTEKKLSEEMRTAKEAAEEANRAKSRFLASMSHELRTPLNGIIGFSEMLHQQIPGPLNEMQSEYVDNVITSGRHLLQLINDILDLSKIEAGRMSFDPIVFDAGPVLRDVKTIVSSLASKMCITLTHEVEDDLPSLEADVAKFKQIIYNLLGNAIKFTPQGGTVQIAARRFSGASLDQEHCEAVPALEVSVTDTGIGIKPADQRRIFEEFEQVDSSYGRTQQGTGLGLALTRKLVELHGGAIRVESEGVEGKGSTFTFVLPFSQAARQVGDEGAEAPLALAA